MLLNLKRLTIKHQSINHQRTTWKMHCAIECINKGQKEVLDTDRKNITHTSKNKKYLTFWPLQHKKWNLHLMLHNFKTYFHLMLISYGPTSYYLDANFLHFKIFSVLVFKYFSPKETNGDFTDIIFRSNHQRKE
jgi:hypothetical protein